LTPGTGSARSCGHHGGIGVTALSDALSVETTGCVSPVGAGIAIDATTVSFAKRNHLGLDKRFNFD
jgi:hypothetical protein